MSIKSTKHAFSSEVSHPRNVAFYWRLFHQFAGIQQPLVVLLAFLSSTLEAVGISLFFPLLRIQELSDPNSKLNYIGKLFVNLGLAPNLFSVLFFIVCTFFLRGVLKALETYFRVRAASDMGERLRHDILTALNKMDFQQYLEWSRWNVTQMMTNQVVTTTNAFTFYTTFLAGVVTIFAFAVGSLLSNWELTFVGASLGGLVGLKLKYLSRKAHLLAQEDSRNSHKINARLTQALNSFKYLKATDGFSVFKKHLLKLISDNKTVQTNLGINRGALVGATQPLSALILATLMFYAVQIKQVDVASVLVTMGLLYKAIAALMNTIHNWHIFSEMTPHLHDVLDGINLMNSLQEKEGNSSFQELNKDIVFSNVSLLFGSRPILTDINLVIQKGQTVGICGASGVGKSTLVDLFMGLVQPTSGLIMIDGQELRKLKLSNWRRHLGYISQDYPLFEDTIINNVTLWDEDGSFQQINEYALKALEDSASLSFIERLPNHLSTRLGEKGISLSAGQKQRLAIARELYKNSSILIFDEATSALDSDTELRIRHTLSQLHGTKTILIITHQLQFLEQCDLIYVLQEGTIREQGTFKELVKDSNSHFAKMYHQRHSQNVLHKAK